MATDGWGFYKLALMVLAAALLVDQNYPLRLLVPGSLKFNGRAPVVPYTSRAPETVPDSIERPPWGQLGGSQKPQWEKQPQIHDEQGIEAMREAGRLASKALALAATLAVPGVTTDFIDKAVHSLIVREDAYPSQLFYAGFNKSTCTSVNEVVVHGMPDGRPLRDGDIVNVDLTVFKGGVHADTSATFLVGNVSQEARGVVSATREALEAALAVCGPGRTFGDIGRAIQAVADKHHMPIMRRFTGHGIGRAFHAVPAVLSYAPKGWSDLEAWVAVFFHRDSWYGAMQPGQTFTIEPILMQPGASPRIRQWADSWTWAALDGSLSAQFEYTVLVQGEGEGGCEVLTPPLWEEKVKEKGQ